MLIPAYLYGVPMLMTSQEITEEKFNDLFINSPVKRTKYTGWKRNLNLVSLNK
ncbi:MAG: hypothetical protein WC139_13950 [Candidatus Kapaibacterium sp.]